LPTSRVSGVWHARNITLIAVSSKYVYVNGDRGEKPREDEIGASVDAGLFGDCVLSAWRR